MSFSKETCDALNETLTIHRRPGPGAYPYVKGEDVIKQLNKAFGHDWCSEVVEQTEVHDQILMLVAVSVFHDNRITMHQGYGSALIARKRDTKEVLDIGNSYKSAFTTALKKAAEQFGVGLNAAGDDDTATTPSRSTAPGNAPRPITPRPATPSVPPTKTPVAPPATPTPTTPAPQKGQGAVDSYASNEKKLSDMQKKALKNISSFKGLEEEYLVTNALAGSGKNSFEDLTQHEAIKVMQFANTLPKK